MKLSESDAQAMAARILAAGDAATSIAPISDTEPGFELASAYRVAALVTAARQARGERPVGWKIGFTNRTIWDEYGVHAPIWAPMYDTTVESVPAGAEARCALGPLVEPRIEPEIALKLGRTPDADMDEAELLGCVEAVAHGFEIVQSVYPGWRFRAADTVAAFALHGRYRHGPFVPVPAGERASWLEALSRFEIVLFRNGERIDGGAAENVLGGPLHALRHMLKGQRDYPTRLAVAAGDIVTTGTVTRAFPVAPGERWHTEVIGLPVPELAIRFD